MPGLQPPRLFIHTTKAIKRGHPANRVFLVVDEHEHGNSHKFIAWKIKMVPQGFWHPGLEGACSIGRLLTDGNVNGKMLQGAEPTAVFKPDSLYQEVSPSELEAIVIERQQLIDEVAAAETLKARMPENWKDYFKTMGIDFTHNIVGTEEIWIIKWESLLVTELMYFLSSEFIQSSTINPIKNGIEIHIRN